MTDETGPEKEIDPEIWIHTLLAYMSDKQSWEALITRMAEQTALPPETVESVLRATLQYLLRQTRSN